jgi:hypothetical protein
MRGVAKRSAGWTDMEAIQKAANTWDRRCQNNALRALTLTPDRSR